MKKANLSLLLICILLTLFLQGCNRVHKEKKLLDDLQNSTSFKLAEGTEVKGLEIIKRLTDKDNHKDTVYVQVSLDNPDVSSSRAYVMMYTLYNDGWMLEFIDEYHEGDYWKMEIKTEPTEDEIMSTLISWSNNAIQSTYDHLFHIIQEGPMYFENGKYTATVSGGTLDGDKYACSVDVVRPFEHVTSFETIALNLTRDPYDYEWIVYSADTTEHTAEWFVPLEWTFEDNQITYKNAVLDGTVLTLSDATIENSYQIENAEMVLRVPSFKEISPGFSVMEYSSWRNEIYCEATFWPDGLWVKDSEGEIAKFSGNCDFYGDYTYGDSTTVFYHVDLKEKESYNAFVTEFLNAIKDHDFETVTKMIHPYLMSESKINPEDTDYITDYSVNTLSIFSDSANSITNYSTNDKFEYAVSINGEKTYIDLYGDSFIYYLETIDTLVHRLIVESLRENNYRIDAVGVAYVEYTIDGEKRQNNIYIVEDDTQLYVWLIGFL